MLVRQLLEIAGVVLKQQFIDGLPQVPEEPFGDLAAVYDAARHSG